MRIAHPERIHPALWRASQLALGGGRRLPSGYEPLDRSLGGGWPIGTLIELLPRQPGIGEVHLIRPALTRLAGADQRIILLNPPYAPSMQCWAAWGLPPDSVAWIQTRCAADASWAAAQVLHYQSSAALLCWLDAVSYTDLLRLHRLALRSAMLAILYRPLGNTAIRQDSPARLRIALQASSAGIQASILKCPGPQKAPRDLTLPWHDHIPDQPEAASMPPAAGTHRSNASRPDAEAGAIGILRP